MSAIFGVVTRAGSALEPLQIMAEAMMGWGAAGLKCWQVDDAGFGQARLGSGFNGMPLPAWQSEPRFAFTAVARLDNRAELCTKLNIPHSDRRHLADTDLILRAYQRWGEDCPRRIYGDWSLAAWHPDERRLFLARDHMGNTALYYSLTGGGFCFAATPRALHAIGVPRRLNELFLAQRLNNLAAPRENQTAALDVQSLGMGQALSFTPKGLRVWRYWCPWAVTAGSYSRLEDYLEGFLELFTDAVRVRAPAHETLASTLSGGLDSSSVTAIAAGVLKERGQGLMAFTHVPHLATDFDSERKMGDEGLLARATAIKFSNIEHHLLRSAHISPIQAIERSLDLLDKPLNGYGNLNWLLDLMQQAQLRGANTLLTGQIGNPVVSWAGAPELRSFLASLRHNGWRAAIARIMPEILLKAVLLRSPRVRDWSETPLRADFARRVHLDERELYAFRSARVQPKSWRKPLDKRAAQLQYVWHATVGETWATLGAAHGMEVRDPTSDVRVIEYALSIPDHLFYDRHGQNRLLIRRAMEGVLPEEVRLCRRIGLQSADIAARLLASSFEVDTALDHISQGIAAEYLDVPAMRRAWLALRQQVTPRNVHLAKSVLLRGIGAGLWLNARHS